MAHGPRKNPLDFDGNPDHVTLGFELGLRLSFRTTPGKIVLHGRVIYTPQYRICLLNVCLKMTWNGLGGSMLY